MTLKDNPTLNFKDTSSKRSLGESASSNTRSQLEGSEKTSVSLAGQKSAPSEKRASAPVNIRKSRKEALKS